MTAFVKDFRAFVQANTQGILLPEVSHSESVHVDYGIPVPLIRDYVKEWLADHDPLRETDWLETLDGLYTGDSVEERSAAGMLLSRHKTYRQVLSLDHFERWLAQLTGWKEVDANCQTVFTPAELFTRWGEWEPFLHQLAASPNLNQQRASLVLLVDVVRSSDDARGISLAITLMQQLLGETDKRITKAISWVLREAVKRHRGIVEQFLAAHKHQLPKATLREVQTKLTTGKKR